MQFVGIDRVDPGGVAGHRGGNAFVVGGADRGNDIGVGRDQRREREGEQGQEAKQGFHAAGVLLDSQSGLRQEAGLIRQGRGRVDKLVAGLGSRAWRYVIPGP